MYEEEVISDTKALYFSPDGNHLAWIEFNDTGVDVMPLQIYGQPGRLEFQYPIPTPLRYDLVYQAKYSPVRMKFNKASLCSKMALFKSG